MEEPPGVHKIIRSISRSGSSTKQPVLVSRVPPGNVRRKGGPPGHVLLRKGSPSARNALDDVEEKRVSPPGNVRRKDIHAENVSRRGGDNVEKKEGGKTIRCKGSIRVKLDRTFSEGTQSFDYYEWESEIRNEIAESLGLSPDDVIITAVEKGDNEKTEEIPKNSGRPDPDVYRELSAEHLKKMEEIFNQLKSDKHRGRVSCRMFIKALKENDEAASFLHLPLRKHSGSSDHSFAERFDLMDVDGKRYLDFESFVAFFGMSDEDYLLNKPTFTRFHDQIRVKNISSEQEQHVRRLFFKFDSKNTGYISKDDFLRKYHHKLPLWSIIDEIGDEFITCNEFVNYFDDLHGGNMSEAAFYKHLVLFN